MTLSIFPVQIVLITFGCAVVVGVVVLALVLIRIMARRHSNFISLREIMAQGIEEFACPRCGGAMAHGFVMAPRGIAWRGAEDGTFCVTRHILENTMNFTFTNKENLAWRCTECRLVVVDHGHLVRT